MWFLLSALSAVFDTAKNIFVKQTVNSDRMSPIVITWGWALFALPIPLVLVFFHLPGELTHTFWMYALSGSLLEFIGMFLFVLALKHGDISLSLPMLVLVPLFLIVTGYFIGQEVPSMLGMFGIVLVVIGAYFLNFDRHHSKIFDPLIAIFTNKGSLYMLITAACWGVSTPLEKVAILQSNAYFFTAFLGVLMAVGFTPLAFFFDKKNFMVLLKPKKWKHIAPAGIADGLSILFQFMAQGVEFSVFVIAIKRTSVIMSSVAGAVLFKEKIKDRIIPIGVMLVGVIAIALSSM